MANSGSRAVSRTEEWLRTHEEWSVPNDDLRAKVIRNACTAQVQANEQAQEKNRSLWILFTGVMFCAAVIWILHDIDLGLHDPQASALVSVADDDWIRPIELHTKILTDSGTGLTYDWSLVQAHVAWRATICQRLGQLPRE